MLLYNPQLKWYHTDEMFRAYKRLLSDQPNSIGKLDCGQKKRVAGLKKNGGRRGKSKEFHELYLAALSSNSANN